jgi:predicted nuclease of predicted toxin-antitoxin system
MLYNITMRDALDTETQCETVWHNVPDREVTDTIIESYAQGFDVVSVLVSLDKDNAWELLAVGGSWE